MKTKFTPDSRQRFIRLLLLIAFVLFFILIKDYIIPLILAIIFAGLLSGVYNWSLKRFKGRTILASITTIVLFVLVIVIPSVFLLWEIIDQAGLVSEKIFPIIEKQIEDGEASKLKLPNWVPFKSHLEPYNEQILNKFSELIGSLSNLIIDGLSSFTQGALVFFLNVFVMLYAMYFFLIYGKELLQKTSAYLPLTKEEFNTLTQKVTSISRATIKGAFLIGIIQGILVGLGFAFAGIPGAIFWGSVAAIMSIIPSLGTAIVYMPAGVYLILSGNVGTGIGLLVWGFAIVSSVDNVLRPSLVGKDTQMPDVLILVSTLGGITAFGISGIIIGPLITGLFISISNIYRDFLLQKENT